MSSLVFIQSIKEIKFMVLKRIMLPLCFTRMCGRNQGVHKLIYILYLSKFCPILS